MYKVVGKGVPRKDAILKVTGRLKFTTDLKLPNMLHAKLLRSPYAHAKVESIDASRAEKMSGVKAVITFYDCPKIKFNPWLDAPHWVKPRDKMILTDHPLCYGDAIAAVAAIDEETAENAIEAIEVKYKVLPAVFDPLEAIKDGAPLLHEDYERNIAVRNSWVKGNVETGFREADITVSDSFKTQDQQHAPLECNCTIANYDPLLNRLTVYTTTQNPFPYVSRLKFALGREDIDVRVITHPLGGAFGGRHEFFQHDGAVALLALKTGRPVKYWATREEVMALNKRYSAHVEFKLGAKRDGSFVALEGKLLANAGAYANCTFANMSMPMDLIITQYRIPNFNLEAYGVYTNTQNNTPLRGFGNPQVFFAFEQLVDDLAEKLNVDPVELRLKNIAKVGDANYFSKTKITTYGLRKCLEVVTEKADWERRNELKKEEGSRRKGLGLATFTYITSCAGSTEGWNESSSAIIYINTDGTVTVITGACELGQGIYTTIAQMAAEVISVPYEKVKLELKMDTLWQPWDWGSFASRANYVVGSAVIKAAEEAKRKILKVASKKFKVEEEYLDIKNGNIYDVRDQKEYCTLAEVAHYATETSNEPGQIMGAYNFVPRENPPPSGAQIAEVEVDVETGEVFVKRVIAAHDVGKAINPSIVAGQIHGGIVMGTGYALKEKLMWDEAGTGVLLTRLFTDYKIPTFHEVPVIDFALVETNDPFGAFGSKGVGEPPSIPTAAAIANAIYHATGVRIKELPITPDKVLSALKTHVLEASNRHKRKDIA